MNFIHITGRDAVGNQSLRSEYFAAACAQKDIHYIRYIDTKYNLDDYQRIADQPADIVYRGGLGQRARSIEVALLQPYSRSIYFDNSVVITGKGSSVQNMERIGLPVVPGIPFLPGRKSEAQDFADYLGGFPLVIKVFGGTEGVGVIRVDSVESLNSVSDFIDRNDNSQVRVMQYVPHEYYARAVVVGEQVIVATKEQAPEGDFRGNTYGRRAEKWESITLNEEMARDAVLATQANGVKAAGVDFILTEHSYYITEINHPFNFAETQTRTGVDIASAILEEMMR